MIYNGFRRAIYYLETGPLQINYSESPIKKSQTIPYKVFSKRKMDIETMDVKAMIFLGILLVILSGIIFYSFRVNLQDDGQNMHEKTIILLTALLIFIGNAGFGLIPSMISSRFPIHLRNIGSSLAYNGGLVIGFASPFISMEFFLYLKNDYLLSIPILLGAISIIIGGKRILDNNKQLVKKSVFNDNNKITEFGSGTSVPPAYI
jgi:hypothetical protein